MKYYGFTAFEIKVCQVRRPTLKFCTISPDTLSQTYAEHLKEKERVFVNYHLAFRPNVPVVLFELDNIDITGSPVFKDVSGRPTYHLPPMLYDQLEDIIKESEFIISYELFKNLIDSDKVYDTILKCLADTYNEIGLNVLGTYYETT